MKIGLVHLKGAVPAFENFGHLPTHIVGQNGMVEGNNAHKVLDGLIIPGGSIVESGSLTPDLADEIKKMNSQGKFILGICSGFQVLAKETDIGRKSPCPIIKEGLGLLDVNFQPMISNDQVEARITDESFLTQGLVGENISGFHCHTYGKIDGDADPVFYSHIRRVNYTDDPQEVLAGVKNHEGNVVGTMIHGCLDKNPPLVDNILNYIDASEQDKLQIKTDNQELLDRLKGELGIGTGITVPPYNNTSKKLPLMIMVGSTGSDSGKTFLNTGLAGALRKKGLKVGILKVGPDIRDIVPALYLIKEEMEPHSSIKIGNLGWMDLENVLKSLSSYGYDIVLIEGVMSVFTGILNEKTPYSSAEIAKAANIPILLVSGCSKGGIETASVDLISHAIMLQKLGLSVPGIILNRVYDPVIFEKAAEFIKKSLDVEMVASVPKVKMVERGSTPEVEIKLEDFCLAALETVEKYLDADEILKMAKTPQFGKYMSIGDLDKKFGSFR
ncbi:AAA family ATPase [Methanobacterium alcaliphilum]|uniref:AAA family ATPase n=1 Tax=Methanobacterium alcaliphilum TaxID=392018 RepID=UPI0024A8131C|nr:AAA family ATPase [Methanobacterium alcaliphilum]